MTLNVGRHFAVAVMGLQVDARSAADTARKDATNLRANVGGHIPPNVLQTEWPRRPPACPLSSAAGHPGCSFTQVLTVEMMVCNSTGLTRELFHMVLGAVLLAKPDRFHKQK